jgi:hypothetical protein
VWYAPIMGKPGRPPTLGPTRSVTFEMARIDHGVLTEIAAEEGVSQGEILRRAFVEFAQRYAAAFQMPVDEQKHQALEEQATAKLLAFIEERDVQKGV